MILFYFNYLLWCWRLFC